MFQLEFHKTIINYEIQVSFNIDAYSFNNPSVSRSDNSQKFFCEQLKYKQR